MDKTTSFLGGIIAGAIGLGVASWYFGEYLPNKKKEELGDSQLDIKESQDELSEEKDNLSGEYADKEESASDEEQHTFSDENNNDNIDTTEIETNPS